MWESSRNSHMPQKSVVIDLDATTLLDHSAINIVSCLKHRGGPELYTIAEARVVLKNSGRFKKLFEGGSRRSSILIHTAITREKPSVFKYTRKNELSTASGTFRKSNTHSPHPTSSTSSSASATAIISPHGQIMDNSSLLPVRHGLPRAYYGSFVQAPLMYTPVGLPMGLYWILPPHNAPTSEAPRIQPVPAEPLLEDKVHPHTESYPFSVTTLSSINKSSTPKGVISASLNTLSTDVRKYFLNDLLDEEQDEPLVKLTLKKA